MRSIFGLNYFVFCITALILILYCTRDMRDEGFGMSPGTLVQLNASHVPSCVREYFGMAPGVEDQMDADEPFTGTDTFPQLEYSTSVNKVDRKIDKQIYDNLTIQGMSRMSPESKYTPYHCPKGLME